MVFSWLKKLAGNQSPSVVPDKANSTDQAAGDQWYGENVLSSPINQYDSYVYNQTTQEGHILANHLLEILSNLATCRSFSEHLAALQEDFPDLDEEILEEQLQELKEMGLFRSTQALYEQLRQDPSWQNPSPAPVAIKYLVIITHNRPESLQRCLDSYLENLKIHQRKLEILIIDGSEKENLERNSQIVAKCQQQNEHKIYHITPEGRDKYCQSLAAEASKLGVPPEITEFALKGEEGWLIDRGGKRNFALLATLGAISVWVDDDTICRFAQLPSSSHLRTSSSLAIQKICPFSSWEEIEAQLAFENLDIWSLHEKRVGSTVQQQLATLPSYADWQPQGTSPKFLSRLLSAPIRIDLSTTGMAGDAGMTSPLYFLSLDGENRQRMVASQQSYHAMLFNRLLYRAWDSVTLSDNNFLMMPNIAIDNRLFFPPLSPRLGNEDGLFILLSRKISRDRSTCFLPLGVKHSPPMLRRFTSEDLFLLDLPPHMYLYTTLAQLQTTSLASPQQRLQHIGEYFVHLSKGSFPEFKDYLISTYLRYQGLTNLGLERKLSEFQANPGFWANDVHRRLELIEKHLQKSDFYLPKFHKDTSEQEFVTQFQGYYRKFGWLCVYWEKICQAASNLQTTPEFLWKLQHQKD